MKKNLSRWVVLTGFAGFAGCAIIQITATRPAKPADTALISSPLASPGSHPLDERTSAESSSLAPASSASATTSGRAFHWSQIESTNYVEYIANLRRIGCPEQTIRDIVIADVQELYRGESADVQVAGENQIRKLLGLGPRSFSVPVQKPTADSSSLVSRAGASRSSETDTNGSGLTVVSIRPAVEGSEIAPPRVPAESNPDAVLEGESVDVARMDEQVQEEKHSVDPSLLPDPDDLLDEDSNPDDRGLVEGGEVEMDLGNQTEDVSVKIPSHQIKAIADRSKLSIQSATAAWFLLSLTKDGGDPVESSAALKQAAEELVGSDVVDELLSVK